MALIHHHKHCHLSCTCQPSHVYLTITD